MMDKRSSCTTLALLVGITNVLSGQTSSERYEAVSNRRNFDYRLSAVELDTSPDSVFRMLLTSKAWEINFVRNSADAMSLVGSMRVDCIAPKEPSIHQLKFFLRTEARAEFSEPSAVYRGGFDAVNRVGFRLDGEDLRADVAVWFPEWANDRAIMYWYSLEDGKQLLRSLDAGKTIRFFFGTPDGGQHMIQWTNKSRAIQAEFAKLIDRCEHAFGR